MYTTTKGYTKKQIADLLKPDLTPHTIQYYTDQVNIIPEIENPSGRGTTRVYSKRNIVEMLVIKKCVQLGVKLERLKKMMAWLNKRYVFKKDPKYRVERGDMHPLDPESERNRRIACQLVIPNLDGDDGEIRFSGKIRNRKSENKVEVLMGDEIESVLVVDIEKIIHRVADL